MRPCLNINIYFIPVVHTTHTYTVNNISIRPSTLTSSQVGPKNRHIHRHKIIIVWYIIIMCTHNIRHQILYYTFSLPFSRIPLSLSYALSLAPSLLPISLSLSHTQYTNIHESSVSVERRE